MTISLHDPWVICNFVRILTINIQMASNQDFPANIAQPTVDDLATLQKLSVQQLIEKGNEVKRMRKCLTGYSVLLDQQTYNVDKALKEKSEMEAARSAKWERIARAAMQHCKVCLPRSHTTLTPDLFSAMGRGGN